ncbi:MAG: Tetratricopeptide 1 repeat-containing protein [Segetibacter sp.]|nr:Tetratricopeptide 1 repeat-containing protein [Segetibacter sp.]
MSNIEYTFDEAKELMRIGRQKESISLLKEVATLGHVQARQILDHLEYLNNLTKKFPVNPLSIVDNDDVNRKHRLQDLVKLYEKDIVTNLSRLQTLNNGLIPDEVTELLIFQTIDNLIEYKNKSLSFLPMTVISQLKVQIEQAFINVYVDRGHMKQIVEDYKSDLMTSIWEPNINEKTLEFMEKLDNKHFTPSSIN